MENETIKYSVITLKEYFEKELEHIQQQILNEKAGSAEALRLARDELARRLEILNGEAGRLQSFLNTCVSKDVYAIQHKEIKDMIDRIQLNVEDCVRCGEYDIKISRIENDIKDLQLSKAMLEGKASQSSVNIAYALSIIGLLIGIIGVVIRFI